MQNNKGIRWARPTLHFPPQNDRARNNDGAWNAPYMTAFRGRRLKPGAAFSGRDEPAAPAGRLGHQKIPPNPPLQRGGGCGVQAELGRRKGVPKLELANKNKIPPDPPLEKGGKWFPSGAWAEKGRSQSVAWRRGDKVTVWARDSLGQGLVMILPGIPTLAQ